MWVFLGAALTLVAIPGPGVLYVVARSVDQGRTAGLVSVLGVGIGNFCQVLLAAVGLAAVVAASATAFEIIRIAGGCYLIWLGIARLRSRPEWQDQIATRVPHRRILMQGVWVAALNPKTALFFVAFLPQFIDAESGAVGIQILILGTIFVLLALIGDSLYALLAGTIAQKLSVRGTGPAWASGSRYVAAGVYFVLGLLALVGTRRPA